jgi:hypothetical protein
MYVRKFGMEIRIVSTTIHGMTSTIDEGRSFGKSILRRFTYWRGSVSLNSSRKGRRRETFNT